MDFKTLKNIVAGYMKQPPSAFIVGAIVSPAYAGVDTLAIAINNARRSIEQLHDFQYSQAKAYLSLPALGASIIDANDGASPPASVAIKRIRRVSLPLAGGDYTPVEFLESDEFVGRVRRQTGRQDYDATKTLAGTGVSFGNPLAYQLGSYVFLAPAAQFPGWTASPAVPVAAQLDVIRFMPDYTADAHHDFIMDNGAEYLQWKAILELNKYWKEFVPRQEGNLAEPEQNAMAAMASLIRWDESLTQSTSKPKPEPESE